MKIILHLFQGLTLKSNEMCIMRNSIAIKYYKKHKMLLSLLAVVEGKSVRIHLQRHDFPIMSYLNKHVKYSYSITCQDKLNQNLKTSHR